MTATDRAGDLDPRTLGQLGRALRDASDDAILRATGVIDRLPERGMADRLLEPVRAKLGALRPPRPPSLSRVLFTPLDPVIVPPRDWRAGDGTIPRTLIAPLSALVQDALSDARGVLATLAAGGEPPAALWREAAALFAGPVPAEWRAPDFQARTGIRADQLAPMLEAIRLVFAHADLFRHPARIGTIAGEPLRGVLLEAAQSGPTGWCVVLGLLLAHHAAPAGLIESALAIAAEARLGQAFTDGLRRVVAGMIETLDRPCAAIDPDRPPTDAEIETLSARIARLVAFTSLRGDMAALAHGLAPRRKEMAVHCSAQLAQAIASADQACVPPGPLAADMECMAAERLTARLRALRRLELAARPLGEADTRASQLKQAASFYCGNRAPEWLTRADRLRLCEILVGAEAALRLPTRP